MKRTMLGTGLALAAVGMFWMAYGAGHPAPTPQDAAVEAPTRTAVPETAHDIERRSRATQPAEPSAAGPRTRPPLDFDDAIATLVALAIETIDRDRAGDPTGRAQVTERAEALLGRVHTEVREPGLRAVERFARSVHAPPGERTDVERGVLARLIADALAEGHARARAGAPRGPLDRLVDALLTLLIDPSPAAASLARLLVDAPYLGAAHESRILEVATLAEQSATLRDISAGLLTTLWRNLEALGDRSSQQLTALALLFGADAEPTRRAAALEFLLTADAGRYREVALARAVETGDDQLVAALAAHAATALPVDAAVAALERLGARRPEATTVGWLGLAQRDPAALRAGYERRLGDHVQPELRAEMVTACGLSPDADSVGLAATAFDLDPDPNVRCRALCALTISAPTERAVAALERAIDDPAFHATRLRVETLVDAIENLAARDLPGAVDRLSARLGAVEGLNEPTRERLRALRSRWLPRGGR